MIALVLLAVVAGLVIGACAMLWFVAKTIIDHL